jgi:sulfur carrier protein
MDIKVNGEPKSVPDGPLAIPDLLRLFKVESPDMVSVQLNGNFVERRDFTSTTVKNGDEIDFLYFMGGGAQ